MSTTPDAHPVWPVSNPTELGRALARIRRQVGLSQQDMAASIGVDRTYLARMESGLSTEQLQRLFALLLVNGYELALIPRKSNG